MNRIGVQMADRQFFLVTELKGLFGG
jgi:hypothetical protein